LLRSIERQARGAWRIMEVCGGQTHTIVKQAIDQLLPPNIELIHGPGCPVCVTPIETIDRAIELALRPGTIVCSFGDMMRVPGSRMDLLSARARGGDVRMVYSPLDALAVARRERDREVVFFAVGFETTAPTAAMAVWQAAHEGMENASFLVSHVTVPPAIEFLLSQEGASIDAFLAAGHVCTVMGYEEYFPLARRFGRPIVVTGFETVDILQGLLMAVRQLESGRGEVENAYARSVAREGNMPAREMIAEVFEAIDRNWRGIGAIPNSGYRLRETYARFDAERRFDLAGAQETTASSAPCGLVLQGRMKPSECPHFARECTPDRPVGAPMVSSEGACAAYYRFARFREERAPTPAHATNEATR
jgi:hydrogenase expression/formation protein HypD